MATCSRPVYPPAVIRSVTEQMESQAGRDDDLDTAILSERLLKLKPCMKQANLRDAVLVKLRICGGRDDENHSDDSFDKIHHDENAKKEATTKATPTAGIRQPQPLVQEVDVRRGREVVQAHSGSAGSLCLVVRRVG